MPDTNRTLADLQGILADNTSAAISPQDLRDGVFSLFRLANKGELLGIDATGLLGALPVDANDKVLTLDSTQPLGVKWSSAGAGSDAANITYTPGVLGDWTSGADPGNVDDALDQLASRNAAHLADAVDAHDASAISNVPFASIAATDVQSALNEVAADYLAAINSHEVSEDPHTGYLKESNTIDFLVGTATAELAGEIVVGATPGGELGGTWASPTVDATHSGSTHSAATDTHIADTSDAHAASAITNTPTGTVAATTVQAAINELATDYASADSTHATAPDPHTGYVLESLLDAKGDLYVASGADTPARLAVGVNGLMPMAVSGQSTGLMYTHPAIIAWATR